MTSRQIKPPNYDRTATKRSAKRYAAAARVLPSVTLDADHAAMIAQILASTGESVSEFVRRMIREQAKQSRGVV